MARSDMNSAQNKLRSVAIVPGRGDDGPMKSSPRVGRNEPCPCGSGRKFKLCCQRTTEMAQSAKGSRVRYLAVAVAVAAVGVALLLGKSVLGPAPADATKTAAQNTGVSVPVSTQWPRPESASRSTGLTPQPPGPVP